MSVEVRCRPCSNFGCSATGFAAAGFGGFPGVGSVSCCAWRVYISMSRAAWSRMATSASSGYKRESGTGAGAATRWPDGVHAGIVGDPGHISGFIKSRNIGLTFQTSEWTFA